MKRRIVVVVLGLIALTAFADANRVWEGSAAVGRYGEFPPTGFYGASNSFPRNSIVDVTNLSNGKSVRIIISGGLADPSMFLVVSEQAADALSVAKNDAIRVRVAAVVIPGTDPTAKTQDLPYSPDPDVNPAARAGDANEVVNPRKNAGAAAVSEPAEKKAVLPQASKTPAASSISAAIDSPAQEAKPSPAPAEKPPVQAVARAGTEAKPSSVPAPGPKTSIAAEASPSAEKPPVQAVARAGTEAKPSVEKPSSVPAAAVPAVAAGTEKSPSTAAPSAAPAVALEVKQEPSPVAEKKAEPAAPISGDDWAKPAQVNRIDDAGALVSRRTPQKDLYPKPRESESFIMVESPKAPAAAAVVVAVPEEPKKVPELAPPPAAPAQPGIGGEEKPIARFSGVEQVETKIGKIAEPAVPAVSVKPIPVPSDAKIALEPAEMKPPVIPKPEVSPDAKTKEASEEALKKLDTIIATIPEKPVEKKVEETSPKAEVEAEIRKEPEGLHKEAESEKSDKPDEKAAAEAIVKKEAEIEAVKPAPAAETADEWAKANLPIVASLKKNSYYLQLVSYGNPRYARNAVDSLASYPVVVLPAAVGDKSYYRVLLGPVNEDEKGILLYKMRSQGFKDAFIRKGE